MLKQSGDLQQSIVLVFALIRDMLLTCSIFRWEEPGDIRNLLALILEN